MKRLFFILMPVFWHCFAVSAELPDQITSRDGAAMVLVSGGPFLMGSADGDPDEMPPHQVNLKPFYIDKFEVTHAQYQKFLNATGHKPPIDWKGGLMPPKLTQYPVVNVTFDDAAAYAKWA